MIFKIFIDKKTEIDERFFRRADKFNDLKNVIKFVDCFFFRNRIRSFYDFLNILIFFDFCFWLIFVKIVFCFHYAVFVMIRHFLIVFRSVFLKKNSKNRHEKKIKKKFEKTIISKIKKILKNNNRRKFLTKLKKC